METISLFAYFAVGFVLLGWQLDIIEEKKRNNDTQVKSDWAEALAFSWIILWLPILACFSVIKLIQSIREERPSDLSSKPTDAWMPQARLI